tara:strand:- start:923 stop:1099 length:177 start_codon:yes stop_codon:yes gene_type:complete
MDNINNISIKNDVKLYVNLYKKQFLNKIPNIQTKNLQIYNHYKKPFVPRNYKKKQLYF